MIQMLPTKLNKFLLCKYLYLKYFHKFIFLHKPLCKRFEDHTIKIFGFYVCKSCSLLYIGFLISLIFIYLSQIFYFGIYTYILMFCTILTFILSAPKIYKNFNHTTKNFLRFFDGFFAGYVLISTFKLNILLGILSIICLFTLKHIYNKQRKARDLCKDCPQLNTGKTCDGYKLQNQALLKIDEEYSEIITESINKKGKNYD